MTHKDFSTIQRMLGFIEGAIFDHDKSENCGILDAIEVIDAILEKEVRTDGAESICPSCDHYPVCRAVDNHPCAECNQYAPVAQHGKWVSLVVKREDWKGVLHDFYQPYSCSICQNPNTFMGESAFCPHCGERMDGTE